MELETELSFVLLYNLRALAFLIEAKPLREKWARWPSFSNCFGFHKQSKGGVRDRTKKADAAPIILTQALQCERLGSTY